MKKYVINLDSCKERMDFFDKTHSRWSATSRDEVSEYFKKKMISNPKIGESEHLGKCGCFISHTNIWRYIVSNKIDNVLVLEDDAEKIDDIDFYTLPKDGITYLGGFFMNPKITDKKPIDVSSVKDGVNKLDKDVLRILMTLSYYIPKWSIAKEMLDYIDNLERVRSIDISMYKIPIQNYFVYPAVYIEKNLQSNIRSYKPKHSTKNYEFKSKIKSSTKQSNPK